MSGYVPVFRTVFDGTLHGRWPHTGLWLALLAMADKQGRIDRSPQAIASDIGIPVEELMACIAEFCGPDPMSRTRENEGRRLELIDPLRPWGWRVINHAEYRERARLMGKAERECDTGANAARLRDRRRPPETAGDRPSYSDAYPSKKARASAAPGVVDAAAALAWERLLTSRGTCERDARMQHAIEAVGGWSAIQLRTPMNSAWLRTEFCRAYSGFASEAAA